MSVGTTITIHNFNRHRIILKLFGNTVVLHKFKFNFLSFMALALHSNS